MISDEADEVIKKLFDSLKNIYQSNLGSIVFDHVKLLYYKCHKINLNHGGSYIDSPDRIKKKQQQILSVKKVINVFICFNNQIKL